MANETSLALTYAPLLTTTLMNVIDSGALHDQVYNNDVFLQWMRSSGRLKVIDGGERIRIGLVHEKNSTAGWYSDYESLNTTAQAGMTAAFYSWKQGSVSVSVHGRELRSNKGPSRITNLQQEKINQAALSLSDIVATGVFSDGTGTSNKQLTGLAAMHETTPGTTAYASVDTDNTNWQNQVQAGVGAGAVNLLPKLRTLYNDCKQGKGGAGSSPDYGVTTQSVHETLESLLFPQVRYQQSGTGSADAGIGKLMFKGTQIDWDDYCTSGELHLVNSNHIMLFMHADANFKMTEEGFQRPINQDALVTQVLFQGNLATNNRRKSGKVAGIT